MRPFTELLKRCTENHTFDTGDPDCKTMLDQLFRAYQESHESDPPEIRDSSVYWAWYSCSVREADAFIITQLRIMPDSLQMTTTNPPNLLQ